MQLAYVLLIIGFIFLVKGADFFVSGSSSIARFFKIPSFIIGLTIVAFGTSAPEAAVSITAAFKGQNDIALGNVVGSNLFNLLAVVGICAGGCSYRNYISGNNTAKNCRIKYLLEVLKRQVTESVYQEDNQ